MSSTTVTEFYGLTQYVGTDKPSFTDNNEAFRNVDGDLHEAVVGVRDHAESISAIRATVALLGDAVVTLQGDLDTEKGKIVNLQNKETLQDTEIATVKANARNMITAYNEETAESTHAYSVGDYFTYNNVLYKATDSIAIGDTIVPDTNCTTDNVTTELIALDTSLNEVNTALPKSVSVTSDGVKSQSQLLDDLYALVSTIDFTQYGSVTLDRKNPNGNTKYNFVTRGASAISFGNASAGTDGVQYIGSVSIQASASIIGVGYGGAFYPESSNVPNAGDIVFTLIYG